MISLFTYVNINLQYEYIGKANILTQYIYTYVSQPVGRYIITHRHWTVCVHSCMNPKQEPRSWKPNWTYLMSSRLVVRLI